MGTTTTYHLDVGAVIVDPFNTGTRSRRYRVESVTPTQTDPEPLYRVEAVALDVTRTRIALDVTAWRRWTLETTR